MADRSKVVETITEKLADLHRSTERLHEAHRADELSPNGRSMEVRLQDMQVAIEQLRVAEEELRVQNEELERNRHEIEAALARYQELFDLAPDPYITTDDTGTIQEANAAALRLLNIPVEKVGNSQLVNFVPAARRRAFRSGLQRVAMGDAPVPGSTEWTLQLKPRRGEPIETAVTVAAVKGPHGEPIRITWLFRDVTARSRAEAEVRTLNAELEQRVQERTAALEAANWAKAEFLSVMAHELRTPLNAIIGYAELLEMGIPGPVTDSQLAHLTRIRSSGQRLIGLISEVLNLGKVEAGQLRVVREECEISDAVDALEFVRKARDRDVNVRAVNMSWGLTAKPLALQDEIRRIHDAGIMLVAAAGNEQSDNDRHPFYPSSFTDEVMSVAASNSNDDLASIFSNYGRKTVDLAAPGVGVRSTWTTGGYHLLRGTSMAAPHVTGAAALMFAQCPSLGADEARQILVDSVDRLAGLKTKTISGGRLNVDRAVRMAKDRCH